MKKGFAVYAGAALLIVLVLSGCGSGKGASNAQVEASPSVKTIKLSLRHTQIKETSKVRLRIFQDVVAKTERENPGLHFELEGIDEVVNRDQKLKGEMAVGNPPDIFEVFGGADLHLYVKANRMLDLTPILKELGITSKFSSLDEFTVDGRVYGLPFGGYSEGIFYNKKIFADLGLSIPTTWKELIETADTLKAKGLTPFALAAKDPWAAGMMWNTIMERNVGIGGFEKLLTGEARWTDPDFVRGFEDYAQLVNNDYFTNGSLGLPYAEQSTRFLKGEAAMIFTGTWDVNRFTGAEAGGLDGSIGYFAFPAVEGGKGDQTSINASYSNGFGFSANLSNGQKEMVKAFIKNFYTEEVQKRTLLEDKLLPSMKLSDLSGVDPLISEVLKAMVNASSSWRAFDAILQPGVSADIGVCLQELIGQVKSPEEVAQQLQTAQDKANHP